MWAILLSAIVAIKFLAMAKPILWEDGSDLYRYATKQVDLSQAKEDVAASSLEAIINGTATASELSIESEKTADDQSRQQLILRIDRGVGYFLIVVGILALFVRRRSLVVASLLLIISASASRAVFFASIPSCFAARGDGFVWPAHALTHASQASARRPRMV